jgi:Amt family ammonium transporter
MHPIGSLFVGLIAGWIFVKLFTIMQQTKKIDDVLGVWPLHGVCGAWGGIAAGIFGLESLGGLGGVSFAAQVIGTVAGIVVALVGGVVVYGLVNKVTTIRLTEEEEFQGADLSIHSIGSINHD